MSHIDEAIQDTAFDAAAELQRAVQKFGPMASPHEGWAVIKEELDELWEHVRGNTGRSEQARAEAIQLAAMALRYAHDVCDGVNRTGAERETPEHVRLSTRTHNDQKHNYLEIRMEVDGRHQLLTHGYGPCQVRSCPCKGVTSKGEPR